MRGLVFDNRHPDQMKIPGEYILQYIFQIDIKRSKWLDLSVLFSMIIIYRLIFFIIIKISEDVTPWIRGYVARRRLLQKTDSPETTLVERSPSLKIYVSSG